VSGFPEAMAAGFWIVFSWPNILYPVLGTLVAMVVSFLPGLSGIMLMALAIPLTLSWDAEPTMLLFGALVGGATFMGSVTAILFNIPGTAPNAATLFDGHPLARKGEARTAIACSAAASALGSTFGILVLVVLLPLLSALVLSFGPLEFLLLALWGLLAIASVARGSMSRGLATAGLGLLLAMVGRDPRVGDPRFTLGIDQLLDGLGVVPVFLGLFALAEIIDLATGTRTTLSGQQRASELTGSMRRGIAAVFRHFGLLLRSSTIGTAIGVIPGIGGTVASFVAYASASQMAGREGRFGEGDIRGVLAPEAANDAKDGGSLLPVFVFGIPGNEGTALLLAAMIIHGLVPGPELMAEQLPLVFAVIWALLLSNWLTSLLGLAGAGLCARLTVLPLRLLVPFLLGLVVLGALSLRGEPFDLVLVVAFGLFGYALKRFDWPRAPFVIAFVLGSLFERQLHLTLQLVEYGRIRFLERPVAMVLMLLIAGTVVWGLALARRRQRVGER